MHYRDSSFAPAFFLRLGLFELLFLTPLIFYGWATTFSSVKQTFAQIVCLVLVCVFFFAALHKKVIFPPLSSVSLFIIFFALFSLLSSLWSASFYASFLGLGVWGVFFFVYFLTSSIVENERWMVILLIATISSGFFAACYGFLQFYGIELPIWREVAGRMRLFSTFGNPNYLAAYLTAALHLGALLFFVQRGKWKILWIAIISILYASLLMTHTRGAWVALFFSSLFVLTLLILYAGRFFKKNKRSLILLTVVIAAITLIYSTPNPLNFGKTNLVQRSLSVVDFKSTARQRLLIWNAALELIREKPFLGWGVGTFGIHYPEAQGKFLSREENRGYLPQTNRSINAHNDYLHIWVEKGLVGL
ncbi:O-antigen ligase family protein, partial [Candidatus Aerophobetes bacterium]|nr:O-antigen ligase family protein [Candidatus Aerophobetes bacterium]